MYHSIREIICSSAQTWGEEDAIRYKTGPKSMESRSYMQVKQDSEHFSLALKELGESGAHVAITGATTYPWIIAYLGTVNSGSVAVPLDASLPAADLCELLDRADVTTFVYDEMRADAAELAREKCPKIRNYISMQKETPDASTLSFWELTNRQQGTCEINPDPDSLCTIMFTSGTTGKSKGVMLTHRNLAENATCQDVNVAPRSVTLSVLPIHHAFCLSVDILMGLSLGLVICINDSLMRVAKNLKLFEPDICLMVPLMIETMAKKLEEVAGLPKKLVKHQVFGKNFYRIYSGGAYLNPDYIDLFAQYGIEILQGYGMTECSPIISMNMSNERKDHSVGKLMPNCEAKIVDEEIWVRGSSVMQGYYQMPQETAETLSDGWLKTGDLGYVDEDGFLFLTGRKKNLIITKNGENVSPEELENGIGSERLVQEILVREKEGVIEAEIFPDYTYASKKHIKDVPAALQEIIDAYNRTAAPYKKVYSLIVRETEFEKTTSKKIKRF